MAKGAAAAIVGVAASTANVALDWPSYIAVTVGLVVGSIMAWIWEDRNGHAFTWRWGVQQVAMWGMIAVLTLFVQEWLELTVRATTAAASLMAFLGFDGIKALRKRSLEQIDGQKRQLDQKILSAVRLAQDETKGGTNEQGGVL